MIRSISCSAAMRTFFIGGACALAVGAALTAAPARAGDDSRYTFRQPEPDIGTHIPRVQGGGPLPLDKPWHELTPDQQALVRSRYEAMAEGDEPPYPLYGPGALLRPLTEAERTLYDEGQLTLFIDVNAKGEATRVEVVKTPSDETARVAVAIAMATKFKPAVCHGQPCAMGYPWRVTLHHDL